MKVAVVNSKDVLDPEKTPTLCLSPLRFTGQCHKCGKFQLALTNNYGNDIEKAINSMKCKPQIDPIFIDLHKEKLTFLKQLREINKKIREIEKKMEG